MAEKCIPKSFTVPFCKIRNIHNSNWAHWFFFQFSSPEVEHLNYWNRLFLQEETQVFDTCARTCLAPFQWALLGFSVWGMRRWGPGTRPQRGTCAQGAPAALGTGALPRERAPDEAGGQAARGARGKAQGAWGWFWRGCGGWALPPTAGPRPLAPLLL